MIWRIFYTKQFTKGFCANVCILADSNEVDAVLDRLKSDQTISKILCIYETKYQARKENGLL